MNIEIRDNSNQIIPLHLVDVIHSLIENGHHVIVNCQAGVSRSTTVIMAYLLKYEPRFNHNYTSVYEYVKSIRAVTSPNMGFIEQLEAFAAKLKNTPVEY